LEDFNFATLKIEDNVFLTTRFGEIFVWNLDETNEEVKKSKK
jgi:hypothetical protein